MILDHKNDVAAFRGAIREWLQQIVPSGWARDLVRASNEEYLAFERWWMSERNKVGLAVPHWPVEYGGADLSLAQQVILANEIARADAPAAQMFIISLHHVPGTLIPFGTEAQKRRYLPGIPEGDIWCQGFSEPGAGSDLASLRCRGIRDNDHYVINGQKIWSSFSMYARYCILLVRTDVEAPKHAGISFFVLDMQLPGVDVRPIRQANGRADFAEIFLTDVRIPAADLIGAENDGWKVAQATLAAERGVLAFEGAERQRYALERYFSEAVVSKAPWLDDDELRRQFMSIFAEAQAARRLIRQLLRESEGHPLTRSMTPVFVKLTGTILTQRINALKARIEGLEAQTFHPGIDGQQNSAMFDYITSFGAVIAAGSNEIMRNIIAERGLGMPKG
jgi:alkylation response protein AidB-like acyl-CoA dehydrogenase